MHITIHVAVADNGVIGADGGMPWKLSTDLKRFKALTMGRPVIMGRKTFESIGRPLPGRANLVVTRDRAWQADGAEAVASLDQAIGRATEIARSTPGLDEVAVIGGGQIYAQALPLADRLHVTHVLAEPAGDTRFPAIDPAVWREASREEVPAGDRDSHATRYVAYVRR